MKRVFVTDCEGPISKNDNAFEIASRFIPDGDKTFTVVSRYDDVVAEVLRRPGYKAGETVKLILPFLKAYDVIDRQIEEFSAENLWLIANAKETLQHIRGLVGASIVSTSYEHYVRALCRALNFPFENAYCTRFSLDKYCISDHEKAQLKTIASEIGQMPIFDLPSDAESIQAFSSQARQCITRLDEIFTKEIAALKSGRIYSEVNTMGGKEKAEVVKDVAQKAGSGLSDVMYVGDSITDEEVFKLVKQNGGLSVSFNGNRYAVENSNLAVLSESSLTIGVIADVFCRLGKKIVLELVENWDHAALMKSPIDPKLLDLFFHVFPSILPKVKIVTEENKEALINESVKFRKEVRGEAIGRLG